MYKIKKRVQANKKQPVLYNVIEDYSESDPPGNVWVCAMTGQEDLPAHAKIMGESTGIPYEDMSRLLTTGGVYLYPLTGNVMNRGVFISRVDQAGTMPKLTWSLDVVQHAEAEQLVRSYQLPLEEAAYRVLLRGLSSELQEKLRQKNMGLDYSKLDRAIAQAGDISYIDIRKDWSPHFKRLCIMPDGRLIKTSGLEEFATIHGIAVAQAKELIEQGGTLEINGEILACQVVNGQPSVARFNQTQYKQAKQLMADKGLHLMDALSQVGLSDPAMMSALKRLERLQS